MFELTDSQRKELDTWLAEHEKATGHITAYAGAIGGNLTYAFTPTSLGDIVKVRCGFCDQSCDLSLYDEW